MEVIKPVSYTEILDAPNAKYLLAEYAFECAPPELGEAKPNRELYQMLEASGGFQAFGVYDEDVLVGFATVIIYELPHFGTKIAATESIFILSSHRKGGSGFELLALVESYAKKNGCVIWAPTAPVGSRFDKILSVRARHTTNVYVIPL